jgi:hypothetical protein
VLFGLISLFGELAAEVVTFGLHEGEDSAKTATTFFVAGALVFTAGKVFGVIRPISYGTSYNRRLKQERPTLLPDIRVVATGSEPVLQAGNTALFRL